MCKSETSTNIGAGLWEAGRKGDEDDDQGSFGGPRVSKWVDGPEMKIHRIIAICVVCCSAIQYPLLACW